MAMNREPPTFLEIVAELSQGEFQNLAGKILGEVIEACAANPGAQGRVTFTLDVQLKNGSLSIEPGFKTKKPYPPLPSSSWWVDDKNQLSLFNPHPDEPRVVVTFPTGGRGGKKGPAA